MAKSTPRSRAAAPSGPSLEQHLRGGELKPIYTLVSMEPILLSDAVGELRKRALTVAADFNRDELLAPDTTGERIVEIAGTLPMMAPRRWVHVAQFHKLRSRDHDVLLSYLERPAATTVLCFSGEKLDRRTKFGQLLAKASQVFTLEAPKQYEMSRWLRERASRRGYDITPDAAGLLADLLGTEIGAIDRALDKLWTYRGAEGSIDLGDVENTIAPTRVHSIFELTDAIGSRDLPKASLLLRNTIDSGEAALRVLAMVTRQFRLLLRIKEMGPGASQAEVSSQLGIAPFLAKSLVTQARRYQVQELWRALDASARADERLKSTRLPHGVVLDHLLVEVMAAA